MVTRGWSHPGSRHYHNISQNNVRSRDQSPILYIPQKIWSHFRVVCCMVILSQHDYFPRAKLLWVKAQLTPRTITTLFSQISHGKSSFNQNMLIFVADPNHGIMKCGLMDKMSVPRVLSTAKWPLLCNKEHIKLAGARRSPFLSLDSLYNFVSVNLYRHQSIYGHGPKHWATYWNNYYNGITGIIATNFILFNLLTCVITKRWNWIKIEKRMRINNQLMRKCEKYGNNLGNKISIIQFSNQ